MSRFKGMYWRQFGISVGLVALTLVLLGASFFSLTYSYMMTERRVELEEKAEIIAQMAERAYSGSSAGLGTVERGAPGSCGRGPADERYQLPHLGAPVWELCQH